MRRWLTGSFMGFGPTLTNFDAVDDGVRLFKRWRLPVTIKMLTISVGYRQLGAESN